MTFPALENDMVFVNNKEKNAIKNLVLLIGKKSETNLMTIENHLFIVYNIIKCDDNYISGYMSLYDRDIYHLIRDQRIE